MPATAVLVFVIFVDPCLVSEPSCSGNHPGPMKGLTTITLQGSHKLLRVGSIRSPAALPRMAVRGRAFLSELPQNISWRYYKGGLDAGVTHQLWCQELVGYASLTHPTVSQ